MVGSEQEVRSLFEDKCDLLMLAKGAAFLAGSVARRG